MRIVDCDLAWGIPLVTCPEGSEGNGLVGAGRGKAWRVPMAKDDARDDVRPCGGFRDGFASAVVVSEESEAVAIGSVFFRTPEEDWSAGGSGLVAGLRVPGGSVLTSDDAARGLLEGVWYRGKADSLRALLLEPRGGATSGKSFKGFEAVPCGLEAARSGVSARCSVLGCRCASFLSEDSDDPVVCKLSVWVAGCEAGVAPCSTTRMLESAELEDWPCSSLESASGDVGLSLLSDGRASIEAFVRGSVEDDWEVRFSPLRGAADAEG